MILNILIYMCLLIFPILFLLKKEITKLKLGCLFLIEFDIFIIYFFLIL